MILKKQVDLRNWEINILIIFYHEIEKCFYLFQIYYKPFITEKFWQYEVIKVYQIYKEFIV